jgi:hypothetical protein
MKMKRGAPPGGGLRKVGGINAFELSSQITYVVMGAGAVPPLDRRAIRGRARRGRIVANTAERERGRERSDAPATWA